MATGYVGTLLNSLESNVKRVLIPAFDYVQDHWKLGPIEDGKRALNAQIYWFAATTSSAAGTEFSVRHNLGQIPSYLITGAPVNAADVQIVPLTVSRAADDRRVYLKSSSTSASIYVGIGL